MSHPQETNPKPDILKQAMNCIYDSNLQIPLDEITDLKTRIENLRRQIIQIIVIPLPYVKCQCSFVVMNETKKKLFSFPFFSMHTVKKQMVLSNLFPIAMLNNAV